MASYNNKQGGKEREREDVQYVEKVINVRRVTKVVKGGKNMRFSALVVVGDGKGRVSFANAKAREVPDAVKKAVSKAKKTLVKIPMKQGKTLHHDFVLRKGSARVCMRSAPPGTGVIAGGAMRSVFESMGMHDIVAKGLGTNTSHNVVRATFTALCMTESPRHVAKRRGLSILDINHRRKVLMKKEWIEKIEKNEVADEAESN